MRQTPQSLADLFTQYLKRQTEAQAEGLGFAEVDGQVVPHEAVPVQPVDPRLAWDDSLAAVRHFPATPLGGEGRVRRERWQAPPDWPALVAAHEPAVALAFCVGNFPQLVRNLHPLLSGGDLSALRPTASRPVSAPSSLLEWANATHGYPQVLLAAGVLRLARRFEEAEQLLRSTDKIPAAWQPVRANEEAALAWHRGQSEEALALWQTQKASVPVLFNRGMASLFLGHTAEARVALAEAVAQLPDTSAWHHLGHLYLALADARG
jgi:hypothetical protein